MTPFELALARELDVEWQRFDSDWLFKWYGMTYEGGITDVEDFKGGRIRYGGIRFGNQQQTIFWQALSRYLTQQVHAVFKRWDEETRSYLPAVRLASLDGVERLTEQFARKIMNRGIETDRALRGRGDPRSVQPYNSGDSVQGIADVARLAQAHRALIEQSVPAKVSEVVPVGYWKWIEKFYSDNKGLIWFVGIIIAAVGVGLPLVVAAWRYLF